MVEIAKILVHKTTGQYLIRRRIPARAKNVCVSVEFDDPVWDGLVKTVVFRGNGKKIAEFDGEIAVVPWEVLENPGPQLWFGIWGSNPETGLQLPLIEVRIGPIEESTDPEADPGTDPTLPIWAQLKQDVEELKKGGAGGGGSQSDWNANEGEPGHILNRTHWTESGGENTVFLSERTLSVDTDDQTVFVANEVPNFVAGERYTVNWNGVQYVCTAQDVTEDGVTHSVIGNLAPMSGGTDTGEPFVIMRVNDDLVSSVGFYLMVAPLDGSSSVTISIFTEAKEIVHKLDNKYLDVDWLPGIEKKDILPLQTVETTDTTDQEYYFVYVPYSSRAEIYNGLEITAEVDGVPYKCVVAGDSMDGFMAMVGDVRLSFYSQNIVVMTTGSRTLALRIYIAEHNKMPVEYLPVAGSELGGVKNGGNVVINADGTMTAPESTESVELDTTLTQAGKAADAKAVGDAISKLSGGNVDQVSIEPAEDDIPDVHFIVKGGMPFTKDEGEVQVFMRYISKTATIERYCTAKVQGSSSASNVNYKKRNWTIKTYKDSTYEEKEKLSFKGWPAMNKFVLKAGWVIPGHLRNVGAAKIWGQIMRSRSDYDSLPEELRNSPNQGATDGFHVRLFINGMYWGIYDWIVAKDHLFGQDKDNVAHSILNSELNNQPTCAFATTSPVISGNWSEELLDSMTADTKTSMENWIKFVAGSTDEEFVANAENYFDVQSVIDAICFDRIIMTVDNMCRNQIVFKYDTKWYMGKWDLDAILGLPPVAGQTWYTYDTAYQEGYVAHKDYGIINMLYDRTEKLFLPRFKENYWRLRSGPLSESNLVEVFGRLSDRLRSIDGLLAEENASTTGNGQFTGMPNVDKDTIQQIRDMVVKRCAFMDEVIENMTGESGGGGVEPDEPEVPETVPCTGITLDKTELTFDGAGTQTITATVTPSDTTDSVVWVSSAPTVASISVEGNACTVQSVANGDAVITVTCGNYSATCSVAVGGIESPNLLESVTWERGLFNGKTGVDIDGDQTQSRTSYFDASPVAGKTVRVKADCENVRIACYDANKTNIITNFAETDTFVDVDIPSTAAYLRIAVGANTANVTVVSNHSGNLLTNVEEINGKIYTYTEGILTPASGWNCKKVNVNPSAQYVMYNSVTDTNAKNMSGAQFNSSDEFIASIPYNTTGQFAEMDASAHSAAINYKSNARDGAFFGLAETIGSATVST